MPELCSQHLLRAVDAQEQALAGGMFGCEHAACVALTKVLVVSQSTGLALTRTHAWVVGAVGPVVLGEPGLVYRVYAAYGVCWCVPQWHPKYC